jgi:hypothetical protein
MSLAMTAAVIDNNDNDNYYNENNNIVNKKRQHNKTQKVFYNMDNKKVSSVIETLHNNNYEDDNDNDKLDDFKPLNPLAPPKMMREKKEGMSNLEKIMNNSVAVPQPIENEESNLRTLNNAFMNDDEVKRYYSRLVANYNTNTNNNLNSNSNSNSYSNNYKYNETNLGSSNQILIDKLNYMINLLEEKQDERTNNVTEEVVLYSFLGIFIIFIVDSFVRVGKYVR